MNASTFSPSTQHVPRLWSTQSVASPQRLDYWVGAICEAFLEMDCTSREPAAFAGQLHSLPVASIALNHVVASTQDVYRTQRAISRSNECPFYLITQLHSAWHVRQHNRSTALRPGDAVLVHASERYELHFPQSVDCLSVQLPRAWVNGWLAHAPAHTAQAIVGDAGWGRALSGCLLQLGHNLNTAHDLPQAMLSDHLGVLLGAALEPRAAAGSISLAGQVALHARLTDLLRQQLDHLALNAADVAAQAQVSVRSLHRCFAANGSTFATTLRALRLTQAATLLAAQRLQTVSVGEIGRRCGFADPSHFVREYQKAFGITPGQQRRERLTGK